ncbi:hypothetical protein GQ53DRAFT_749831 [Thozetella sp. PMI_491]|nr:hypothetical protein GQ53DRAFT_749831 [Thozetella sp. PMI_491]
MIASSDHSGTACVTPSSRYRSSSGPVKLCYLPTPLLGNLLTENHFRTTQTGLSWSNMYQTPYITGMERLRG